MPNEIQLGTPNQIAVGTKLDAIFNQVQLHRDANPFVKMYVHASAIKAIGELLTDEYMEPIMTLQGRKLGFQTDNTVYKVETVRNCLIEAGILGLQPVGNQFNILAGRMYPTKEGFTALVASTKVWHRITPGIPKITGTESVTAFTIEWKDKNGSLQKEVVEFTAKVNNGMGLDAVIGKGERKAYRWLFKELTQIDVADSPLEDPEVMRSAKPEPTAQSATKTDVKTSEKEYTEYEEVKNDSPVAFVLTDAEIKLQKRADDVFSKCSSVEDLEKQKTTIVSKFPKVELSSYNKRLNELSAA